MSSQKLLEARVTKNVLDALGIALAEPNRAIYSLTERESAILDCIGLGMTNMQIADHFGSAVKTVKNQISSAIAKTGAKNRWTAWLNYSSGTVLVTDGPLARGEQRRVVASEAKAIQAKQEERFRRRAGEAAGWSNRLLAGETLQQVADSVGLTKQRIYQILRKAGFPTDYPKVEYAEVGLSARARAQLRVMAQLEAFLPDRPEGECWNWTGPTWQTTQYTVKAHPRIAAFDPLDAPIAIKTCAYRVMYLLNRGPIPKDKRLYRTCFNELCCNPAHLALASREDLGRIIQDDVRIRRLA